MLTTKFYSEEAIAQYHALDAALGRFETIFTTNEVWDILFSYVKLLGVEAVGYHHLPPPGAKDFDERIFVARGFSTESVRDYKQRHALSGSPFINRTLALNHPILWGNIRKECNFSEEQWTSAKSFFYTYHDNGIVIPVHGPINRDGCVVLRFEDPSRRYTKSEIRKIQWMCQYAHQKFCDLQMKKREKIVPLSTREREILAWVARGKSNSVIAEIIGISKHTVNGYLRRIYLKTGTSDRTAASLRGIGEALIDY